jgi:ribosomal protein S18 acetylase RimI-like enzyme
MEIEIRQATLSDEEVLLPQILVSEEQHAVYEGGHVTDQTRKRVTDDLSSDIKKEKFWVAEAKDQVVGFIKAEIMDTQQDTYIIDLIFVDEPFRHKGIGTKLINYAEDFFKAKGVKKSSLYVARQNTDAESLYQKLGFKYKKDIWKKYEKEL